MSFKQRVQNKILENSDTYNFYKDQYESQNQKTDKKLEKRIAKLEKEHNEILDSYNHLFNILFLDYELKPKGVLRYSQEFCLELLSFVDKICAKHDIDYWIDFGNLLGAVRHGGYIPWDDDMDCGMMRKDYEKFLSVFDDEVKSRGLEDNFNLRIYKNDKILFVQIVYVDSDFGMIGALDIFPYDFIKSFDETTEEKFKEEKKAFKRVVRDGGDIDAALKEYMDKFNVTYEKQDYVIGAIESIRSPFSKYSFDVLDSDELFPLAEIEFCEKKFKCPKNPDYWLTSIYGDYHKIHKVVNTHTRLYNIKKRPGSEDVFIEHLTKFRKINEEF